ncbi:hypothetical protein HY633_05590 [Candidatus Uhrbacteria bacterium]|nr:hypothetical protein [Candidatus Uhrbacteria bacterium]
MPSIEINLNYFPEIGDLPFPLMMWRLFVDGGWIPTLIIMIQGFWLLWVQWRQNKFAATLTYNLLAIDIPRTNEQTPKAVEQVFSLISGAYSNLDAFEKYWIGKFQLTFSFEIVSIGGYIQYLVRTPTKFRDLVESAIYAQYPDAEIVEVSDYTGTVPKKYPDPEYELFGTEFVLGKPAHYPIRTTIQFEHNLSEEYFKDPLSSLLEVLGTIRASEQVWLQFLVTPTDDKWKTAGEEAVNKLVGKKTTPKKSLVDDFVDIPMGVLTELGSLINTSGEETKKPEKKDDMLKMLNMTPGERGIVEAIQMKLSKVGLRAKIRMVYVGRRDVFSKGRIISSIKGALSQFSALNMNGFKNYGKVMPKGDYFYQRWFENGKKMRILSRYKSRSNEGAPPYVLNIEELASIYHFPVMTVKAPTVKKTEAKKAEPPAGLPMPDFRKESPFKKVPPKGVQPPASGGGSPSNLPFA